jgi:sec-independent protein translocase protein TatA
MDILGIGFPELIFIFLIALILFGPRRLPEIAAQLGKFARDLRNMSEGFLTEWQREVTVAARLEELEKTHQEIKEVEREVTTGLAHPPAFTPVPANTPQEGS